MEVVSENPGNVDCYLSVERLPLEDLPPGGLVVDVVDADDVRHVVLTQVVVLPPKMVMINRSLIIFLNKFDLPPSLAEHGVPEHLLRWVHPSLL